MVSSLVLPATGTAGAISPITGTARSPQAAASTFYLAEAYHQDNYKKNPVRYNYYRTGCGRDAQLKRIWK